MLVKSQFRHYRLKVEDRDGEEICGRCSRCFSLISAFRLENWNSVSLKQYCVQKEKIYNLKGPLSLI